MSEYELQCAYEDLTVAEAQRDLAWKMVQQYRTEIRNRPDLVAGGFCQGGWFEESYKALDTAIREDRLPQHGDVN